MNNQELHISIISPSDVAYERNVVEEVCDEINKIIFSNDIEVIVHRYENDPPNYHVDPQTNFYNYNDLNEIDILVVIVWYRIGTPLVDKFFGKVTNTKVVTGTQCEVEDGIFYDKPLWLYQKNDGNFSLDDVQKVAEQKEGLDTFLDVIGIGFGKAKHTYHSYFEKDFKRSFTLHLKKELEQRFNIKIKLPKIQDSIIEESSLNISSIHPNYLAGLYGFLLIVTVMLFLWSQESDILNKDIKNIIHVYSVVFFGAMVIAVQGLPVVVKKYTESTFKKVFYTLLRKASFIIFFSLLLSVFIWFFMFPQIQKLFTL